MIEINLLKALSIKSNLDRYVNLLNTKTLSVWSIEIIKDYQRYFEAHQIDKIDFGAFREFFFIIQHPNLDEKSEIFYKEVIDQIDNVSIEGISATSIIVAFEQQELYDRLHHDLDRNIDLDALVTKITTFTDKVKSIKNENNDLQEDMDLTKALVDTDRSNGLRWRLKSLQDHFNGGLIKGDFGIIAGYVDTGKTGFLCSEISYMAQQLTGNQWIAWLNTEGNWQQILPRIYCAALNCTHTDLTKHTSSAILKYEEKMNGNINRIKVLNYQRKSTADVEKLIRNNPPSLIVFDLLDALRGFEKYIGGEGNVTERYQQLYQWARTIATEYCPVLAISQLNGNGNNEPYPSITDLRGSRVDKQGAATFQLIIGAHEGNSTERYLSMPKNKVNSNKGWRCAATFDPLRSRFIG